MTIAKFYRNEKNYITKLEVSGHTGFGVAGTDTLCAAISGIVQAGALGILKVLNISAHVVKNDETGYFLVELPKKELPEQVLQQTQIVFLTMLEAMKDLQTGYPKNIKLEEK